MIRVPAGMASSARAVQRVDELDRRRFFAGRKGGDFFRQFDADHQAQAAHLADDRRIFSPERVNSARRKSPDRARVGGQIRRAR